MVDFNSAWEADFLQGVNKLPTTFLNKPTGLDGHHIGTKSNVTSHPDLRVQKLLIELGTRLETHTDANGIVTKRAFYDTGNNADNFIGLPSSGVDGVAGGLGGEAAVGQIWDAAGAAFDWVGKQVRHIRFCYDNYTQQSSGECALQ